MQLSLLLADQIVKLFILMVTGFLIVRTGLLKMEDSRGLSLLSVYIITPCTILNALQVSATREVWEGLRLALLAAVLIHFFIILFSKLFLHYVMHLDAVERCSVVYSNAGNLIIPLVTAVLGQEWVIYSTAFLIVQLCCLWTHGVLQFADRKAVSLRKVLLNVNVLSILVGLVFFVTGWRIPGPLGEAVHDMAGLIGPVSMIVAGMLIGNMHIHELFSYSRMGLVLTLRMLVLPMFALLFLKYSGIAGLSVNGPKVLMITLMACCTQSASTVIQLAQVYHKDSHYASAINVLSTILCIFTLPAFIMLYQL